MDPRHLKLYNEELHFIREMGKIFAKNHPDVAKRLDLSANECTDPYVERLLEGFAFLTSRVQLQYQEEFPEFTQHLIDIIYPDFLSPLPSTSIIQFNPDREGKLKEDGHHIKRHTRLLSNSQNKKYQKRKSLQSSNMECEFRTAHDIHLWPIEITDAKYLSVADIHEDIKKSGAIDNKNIRGAIKLSLEIIDNDQKMHFSDLANLDQLSIYLSSTGNQAGKLYELLLAHLHKIIIHNAKNNVIQCIDSENLTPSGFEEEEALLPTTRQGFQGYRLLQEYFAQPKRFMFLSLKHLRTSLKHFSERIVDIYFLLNKHDEVLSRTLEKDNFKLNCTPVINLFEKTTNNIRLTKKPQKDRGKIRKYKKEVSHYLPGYPIIVDKSRPLSFEIYRVLSVKGIGNYEQEDKIFHPFYSLSHSTFDKKKQSFYTLKRKPETRIKKNHDRRKTYQGNELYISLSDNDSPLPYSEKIKELRINTLATNRGEVLNLRSLKNVNFTTPNNSLPVSSKNSIQNIEPFTYPKPAHLAGEHTWKLINLLSLNHLSIAGGNDGDESVKALRELLELQIHTQSVGDSAYETSTYEMQINKGLHQIETKKIVHPLYVQGKITYARGLQIIVTLDEEAFENSSAFLFGSVLEKFFAQYTSINSFTQTVVKTLERDLMTWPIRTGNQKTL